MSLLILHTNDTHGVLGKPETGVAEALRRLCDAEKPDLYLDAGDTISAGNLGVRLGGEPALEVLSELGCNAMTLGNRETHPRKECFPRKVDRARFPLLCANMQARGEATNPTRPHLVWQHKGVSVGILGVSVPMFTSKQWTQPLCDYTFHDPLETAKRQVEELRPQVEVLIALTHIGYARDLLLADACPELDLIIGGHSHTELAEPTWRGRVPVVQARSHGYLAGLAQVEVAQGRGVLRSWRCVPLRSRA